MRIASINSVKNTSSSKNTKVKKPKKPHEAKEKEMKIGEKEESGVKVNIIKLWGLVPFFIKFMSFITLIFYILNLFFKDFSFYLSNIPLYTVYHFQIWRLFTSFLITTNIFNVILGLIFWTREGSSMEIRMGSLKYILIFLRNNCCIQILYTLIILLISLITKNKNFMEKKIIYENDNIHSIRNCGFWPVIMCELTLLCLCNPNTKVKFLFIPFNFSAKFYPFLWFIFFCIVNTKNYNNDLEVLVGILFALIHKKLLKNISNISDKFISKIENKICCECFLDITGFVRNNQFNNSYMDNKTNKRVNEQVISMKKVNSRPKVRSVKDNVERDVKVSSDYTSRSDNSMIHIIIPKKSLFDKSFNKK